MTAKRDAVHDVVESEIERLLKVSKRLEIALKSQRDSLEMTQADLDFAQARIAELEGFLTRRKEVAA